MPDRSAKSKHMNDITQFLIIGRSVAVITPHSHTIRIPSLALPMVKVREDICRGRTGTTSMRVLLFGALPTGKTATDAQTCGKVKSPIVFLRELPNYLMELHRMCATDALCSMP